MPSIVLRKRKEHVFFSSIAFLLVGYVLLGFWQSYFAQGMFLAPLPSLLVQVHAFIFLGSRLVQSQNAKAVASATPDRKLAASLS